MQVHEQRAAAVVLDLRVHIERMAAKVMNEMGFSADLAGIAQRRSEQRRIAPRFAASVRISGSELITAGTTSYWVPATQIEALPAYSTLAAGKAHAVEVFERLSSQTQADIARLQADGEYPFMPKCATVLDQFGHAIARMEIQESAGDSHPVWVGEAVFEPAHHAAQRLRLQAEAVSRDVQKLKSANAPLDLVREMRREAQRLMDRASIIELSDLVVA